LLLLVDQDEKAAVVVIERIDAHRPPVRLVNMSATSSKPYWRQTFRSSLSVG
jgi:hypothetical protein